MRSVAVFPERREVAILEQPQPSSPGRGQVLLQVCEVGLCHTDRDICSFVYGEPPEGSDHLIIGHESLAEVAEVGPGADRLTPGELVVPMVRRPCPVPSCRPCRADHPELCTSGAFRERGIKQLDGFLSEWVLEQERYLVPVPRHLARVAILVEPLTIVARAAAQLEALADRVPWQSTRGRGLVLGAGPVGLLGAMMLVARGFQTLVYSREPAGSEPAELIEALGASYVCASDTPLAQLAAREGGVMDVIFEAAGVYELAFEASAALAPNGVLVLSGAPSLGQQHAFDSDHMMRKMVLSNQLIIGTVSAAESAYTAAVRELRMYHGMFPRLLERLISRRMPITQAPEALAHHDGIKEVVVLAAHERRGRSRQEQEGEVGGREWIDVTVPIHDHTVHPLTLGSHAGTHVDAPANVLLTGTCVDELSLDATVGEARVIAIDAAGLINADVLAAHLPRTGERILIKTRNSSRGSAPARDQVHLDLSAARYLVLRGVRTVGIDYLSIGGGADEIDVETHRILLAAGICIIEGLDLSRVSPGWYQLLCLPLRIQHGDAAPARAWLQAIPQKEQR